MDYDVIIIGGSYAGLSAGLQLARARRNVLIVDADHRRNRFTDVSHGFITHDGQSGGAIIEQARKEVAAYPTVEWIHGTVEKAEALNGKAFTVTLESGLMHSCLRLILAYGVIDDLPDIPGLAEQWGKSVFHCPYCHGYELDGGNIGVLATSSVSMHHGIMLPDWGRVTFFVNKAFEPEAEQWDQLRDRGALIETQPISRMTGNQADVELTDGRVVALRGLFTLPCTRLPNSLAEQLGCAIEEGSAGVFIQTDASKETSVAGVFACGDAARPSGSVSLAVGDGALAGVAAHLSLVFE